RRKAPFLSAMVVVAEGARADTALTAGFSVSPSSVIVSFKRPGCWAGTVVISTAPSSGVHVWRPVPFVGANTSSAAIAVNSTALAGVPAGRSVRFVVAGTVSAAVAAKSAAVAVNSAARVSASIVVVAVIKRI